MFEALRFCGVGVFGGCVWGLGGLCWWVGVVLCCFGWVGLCFGHGCVGGLLF